MHSSKARTKFSDFIGAGNIHDQTFDVGTRQVIGNQFKTRDPFQDALHGEKSDQKQHKQKRAGRGKGDSEIQTDLRRLERGG